MSDLDRVMIDLETLGTEPGAAILSIGAVRFSLDGLEDTLYHSIDLESCQDAGLSIDAGTLDWWLDQDEEAREAAFSGDITLEDALEDFADWYGDADEIWAFSPSFDCEILGAAYEAIGEAEPWSYRDERCARTLAALPIAADVDRVGTEHDALDDAQNQAWMVSQTLAGLEGGDDA